ncbi:MAG: AIR synthase family protein [Clostridiales Family XIII bacterium]|jgi:hydrogenase expression/formation protein HypE|nr:AIR synthase family protein [Clostridiales Family XIII bacterium]
MKIGKVDGEVLKSRVFGKTGAIRPEVAVGPGIGEDCAVINFGGTDCVLSSDPITASADRIGRHAVHVACNDIAAAGAEPVAVMLTVLLPEGSSEEELAEIAGQADEAAKEIGVMIAGGHTEVSSIVTRPLISATAIGRADADAEKKRSAPKPGDVLVVTRDLGLEGTAIIAEAAEDRLLRVMTQAEIDSAKAFLDHISVVAEGRVAAQAGFSDMHDITEGGVLGAVHEVCELAGTGAEVSMTALPFDELTLTACAELGLDPMRLISSGSMLIVLPFENEARLTAGLEAIGVKATAIGRITEKEKGVRLIDRTGKSEEISPPDPDEIYKVV